MLTMQIAGLEREMSYANTHSYRISTDCLIWLLHFDFLFYYGAPLVFSKGKR
jgi:hypothetical protein